MKQHTCADLCTLTPSSLTEKCCHAIHSQGFVKLNAHISRTLLNSQQAGTGLGEMQHFPGLNS